MEIIDNRALQFVTRKADQITALIPKSKVIARKGDQAKIIVNWGHNEAKLLRNLQIKDVPHPITGRYKWPGVYTPFSHQRETAAFLATHPKCLLLSEAGTGKTSAAAWAADRGGAQHPAQRRPAAGQAMFLRQQFVQMAVVVVRVGRPHQRDDLRRDALGEGV